MAEIQDYMVTPLSPTNKGITEADLPSDTVYDDSKVVKSDATGVTGFSEISLLLQGTKTAYDALGSGRSATTLFFMTGA